MARLALLSLLLSSLLCAQALHDTDGSESLEDDTDGWESLEEYRAKHNITFLYRPKNIPPEYCCFMTEEQCSEEDKIAGEGKEQLRKTHRKLSNSIGTFRALVLLVRFSDHTSRSLPTRQYFQDLCNTNSLGIKEYFKQQSYDQYNIECDVKDWVTTDGTESFYADGRAGLLGSVDASEFFWPTLDALDDPGFDWSQYDADGDENLDAVLVIHSGYAAEAGVGGGCAASPNDRIHSQGHRRSAFSWEDFDGNYFLSGYSVASAFHLCSTDAAKMAIMTHEWIHTFGVPDLYDLSSGGVGGLGAFDIMSLSVGPANDASLPGSMSPYSKMVAGWLEPTEITTDGTYTIRMSNEYPDAYIVREGFGMDEYLLIENRQQVNFDARFYGGGLLIYHIDNTKDLQNDRGFPGQSGWPQNNNHYQVALLQADGNYDIEHGVNNGDAGDIWTEGMTLGSSTNTWPNTASYQNGVIMDTGFSITDISASGETMTFRVTGLAPNPDQEQPAPTPAPVVPPSPNQTGAPVLPPTQAPVVPPSPSPTRAPVVPPSHSPTRAPVLQPTAEPSPVPTKAPVCPPSSVCWPDNTPDTTPEPTKAPVSIPDTPTTEAPTPLPVDRSQSAIITARPTNVAAGPDEEDITSAAPDVSLVLCAILAPLISLAITIFN